MLKYWTFMEEFNVSEDFFLRGVYPIIIDEAAEQAKAQDLIDAVLKENYRLDALLEEKKREIKRLQKTIQALRESLKLYGDKYGKLEPSG